MRIEIDINDTYRDTEVTIRAPRLTRDIEKMVALMRMIDMQIGVKRGGETYLLDAGKILYIETVDRKTFVYTENQVYESDMRLYEMEQELLERDFFASANRDRQFA